MSAEMKFVIQGNVDNGAFHDTIPSLTVLPDQAAIGAHMPIVSVGTSEEDMPIGDVATPGWLFLKNLDGTNYVTWGPKSGGVMAALGKLKAGEFAIFRMDGTSTLRWIANTAAVKVQVKLYES